MWQCDSIRSGGLVLLGGFALLILSSALYQWMLGIAPQGVRETLIAPFLAMQVGHWLAPITALSMAAWLISATALIYAGRLCRFIGWQMLGGFAAFVVAAWIVVLIDGYLLEGLRGFTPSPKYLLAAIVRSKEEGNANALWSSVIGFGGVGILYGAYVIKILFQGGKVLGSARFANGWDIYRADMFSKEGFVLAQSPYGPLIFPGFEPIIFVSGTKGGKTNAVVIPNMVALSHENIVVTDIKGEIYAKTHRHRLSLGQAVYRFEPASLSTHRYNPLGLVRPEHIDEDLDLIFKVLIPDSNDSLWSDASRNIAKMLAMEALLEYNTVPTLQGIYQDICQPEFHESLEARLEQIKTPRVSTLFKKFLSTREKLRSDILINAREYLSKFDSPNLAHATSGNDFDFRDLRKQPMTIYLIMPANTETFSAIGAVFFEQMIQLTTEKNNPEPSEYSINAIIDEFANLPKMPSLAKGVSFLRSYRIRVCAFVQQIAQLQAIYGESKKEGFMSTPVKVAFNVTSKADAEYFSSLAGKKTITVRNKTTHQDGTTQVSTHKQARDLLTPDEVMRLRASQLLIYRTGYHVIKAKKNFWFKHQEYREPIESVESCVQKE